MAYRLIYFIPLIIIGSLNIVLPIAVGNVSLDIAVLIASLVHIAVCTAAAYRDKSEKHGLESLGISYTFFALISVLMMMKPGIGEISGILIKVGMKLTCSASGYLAAQFIDMSRKNSSIGSATDDAVPITDMASQFTQSMKEAVDLLGNFNSVINKSNGVIEEISIMSKTVADIGSSIRGVNSHAIANTVNEFENICDALLGAKESIEKIVASLTMGKK